MNKKSEEERKEIDNKQEIIKTKRSNIKLEAKNKFYKVCKKKGFDVLGIYINSQTKIELKCKTCETKWTPTPSVIGNETNGCPTCSRKNSGVNISLMAAGRTNLAKREFEKYCNDKEIKILSKYTTTKGRIDLECKKCGYKWNARISGVLYNKSGCDSCVQSERKKITFEKIKSVCNKKQISINGKYINPKAKIKLQCQFCEHKWATMADNILYSNSGCPACAFSKGEMFISIFLKEKGIEFIEQWKEHNCVYKRKLMYDFYLPTYNTVIEFHGKQHYEFVEFLHRSETRFEQQQERDQLKKQYCLDNGIAFLEIPFSEYENIEVILSNFLQLPK
jgi:hypothetical protein